MDHRIVVYNISYVIITGSSLCDTQLYFTIVLKHPFLFCVFRTITELYVPNLKTSSSEDSEVRILFSLFTLLSPIYPAVTPPLSPSPISLGVVQLQVDP